MSISRVAVGKFDIQGKSAHLDVTSVSVCREYAAAFEEKVETNGGMVPIRIIRVSAHLETALQASPQAGYGLITVPVMVKSHNDGL